MKDTTNIAAPERLMYRPREAAHSLNVGLTTLYALMRDGNLKASKVGRATLIARAEIERFIDSLPAAR